MTKFTLTLLMSLTGICFSAVCHAQQRSDANAIASTTTTDASRATTPPASIKPYTLGVSYNKTTNIIFPYAIKSVDMGSAALMAQKARGVENILQLKAAEKGFPETNLSVVTADGKFYSFLVRYAEDPQTLNISFIKHRPVVSLKGVPDNQAHFDSVASVIRTGKKTLHIYAWNGRTRVSLDAIYLTREMIYMKIAVKNFAPLDYKPSVIRFYLTDRKIRKRTAVQQKELYPVYQTKITPVKYGKAASYVFAFFPFSIPASEKLIIHLEAENGQGILTLKVSHREFQKEKLLRLLRAPAQLAQSSKLIQTFSN